MIVLPLNGSVYEIQHGEREFFMYGKHGCVDFCSDFYFPSFHLGSAEEMYCIVLTECQTADSTEVMWLVNSQSVESSYLHSRALQGGRRYTFT